MKKIETLKKDVSEKMSKWDKAKKEVETRIDKCNTAIKEYEAKIRLADSKKNEKNSISSRTDQLEKWNITNIVPTIKPINDKMNNVSLEGTHLNNLFNDFIEKNS